ncbi:hypothetical protein BDP27DRAFT_1431736 [Rhodocollybia butyracea]|uniref:Ubiquitin-like protease family profile domain-containing protein n=1 Tax=Rhodocollybia butyracea TaxID=206335 RepID=A0A9P5P8C9_9AGAR|nr:hypothetical protein BDP27DRAFT_1431736 [Rhodocollybia butyracea]
MKGSSTISYGTQHQDSKTKPPSRFNFQQNTPRKLPLKAVFFGLKRLPEGYNIIFRPNSRLQANGFSLKGPENYMETITFAQSVENVVIGGISVSKQDPCAQFTIKALDPRISHHTLFPGIGRSWGVDFQQGSALLSRNLHRLMFVGAPGCRGTVTIKFDTRDISWSDETFNEFRFLCKNAAQRCSDLVGQAMNNLIWDEALNAAGVCSDDVELHTNLRMNLVILLNYFTSHNDLVVNDEPKAESSEHQSTRRISDKSSALLPFKCKKIKPPNLAAFPSLPEAESPHVVNKPAAQGTQSTPTSTAVDGTLGSKSRTQDVNKKHDLDLLQPELKKHLGTMIPHSKAKTARSRRPKSLHIDTHDTIFVFYLLRFQSPLISPSTLEHFPTTTIDPQENTHTMTTPSDTKSKSSLSSSEHEHTAIAPASEQVETLILTMNSLGIIQERAVDILGKYLQIQGKEKKNAGNLKCPNGRALQVPQQPNTSDCSIYLLHFAQVFVEKAEHLIKVSNTRSSNEVNTDWEGARVKGLCEDLRCKIMSLCASWKAEQQEKETLYV